MSRQSACHAIILRTVDIGEADRFCILFTWERGRLAARASGVRRPGSRIAGHLLPLATSLVEFVEGKSGLRITAARPLQSRAVHRHDIQGFLQAQQGMELLLRLLHDDEPLPDVFDLTSAFLAICADETRDALVPFGLRLLSLLGLLPTSAEQAGFHALPPDAARFLRRCAEEKDLAVLCALYPKGPTLETLLFALLEGHLSSPLKAKDVALSIQSPLLRETRERTTDRVS